MSDQHMHLPASHQAVLDRFLAACQSDERVVAAFLGGSNARGEADAHSDIDLCVITTDTAFDNFLAERAAFLKQLGEPAFCEDFGLPAILFFVLDNGVEGELYFAREGGLDAIYTGVYRVLVDKRNLLSGITFIESRPDFDEQRETLHGLIVGFWHELSHFMTAMGRGQLWWAYGQLEALRRHCVGLARLQHDFTAWAGGDEPYFKVEKALPQAALAPLISTCVTLEQQAMLTAARDCVEFYRTLAQPLAEAHGISYPITLDKVMDERLKQLTPFTAGLTTGAVKG